MQGVILQQVKSSSYCRRCSVDTLLRVFSIQLFVHFVHITSLLTVQSDRSVIHVVFVVFRMRM